MAKRNSNNGAAPAIDLTGAGVSIEGVRDVSEVAVVDVVTGVDLSGAEAEDVGGAADAGAVESSAALHDEVNRLADELAAVDLKLAEIGDPHAEVTATHAEFNALYHAKREAVIEFDKRLAVNSDERNRAIEKRQWALVEFDSLNKKRATLDKKLAAVQAAAVELPALAVQ